MGDGFFFVLNLVPKVIGFCVELGFGNIPCVGRIYTAFVGFFDIIGVVISPIGGFFVNHTRTVIRFNTDHYFGVFAAISIALATMSRMGGLFCSQGWLKLRYSFLFSGKGT